MIEAIEKNDTLPVCPHCKAELPKVWYRRIMSILGKRFVYFCPSCRAVLGISHRKGFWMG